MYVDLSYVLDLLKMIEAAYPAVILPSSLKVSLYKFVEPGSLSMVYMLATFGVR